MNKISVKQSCSSTDSDLVLILLSHSRTQICIWETALQVNAAVVVKPSVLLAFHEPVPWLIARLMEPGCSPETTRSPSVSQCELPSLKIAHLSESNS